MRYKMSATRCSIKEHLKLNVNVSLQKLSCERVEKFDLLHKISRKLQNGEWADIQGAYIQTVGLKR